MHIPDGFLTPPVWTSLDLLAVPAVSIVARKTRAEIDESRIPLLGVMGAFVFAAQMINFPVGLGTSGHLVGGTLLACILGPGAAVMVMTAILAIQALVFQDGGIVALGANVLNMAFAGVLAGYLPYHYFGARWRRAAIFSGAFLSVLVSAFLALSELLVSGVRMPRGILLASLLLFAVSAAIEGLITVAAIEAIGRLQPSWVRTGAPMKSPVLAMIGVTAVFLVSVGILFTDAAPDGIASLAQQIGIAQHAKALFETPLASYTILGLHGDWRAQALAGIAGLGLVFAVAVLLARIVRRRPAVSRQAGGA